MTSMSTALAALAARVIPSHARRWLLRATRRPRVGRVDLGSLDRLTPISRDWGGDRGTPIDRYYIERFLVDHAPDVRGRVLEIGGDNYTRKYGTGDVTKSDVLCVSPTPQATLVADLAHAPHLPTDAFDCVICTQTLHLIADTEAAVATIHRILKPGGVLLTTVPAISRVALGEPLTEADYWRFTSEGLRRLLSEVFGEAAVEVSAYGNVLSAVSFLHGLSLEELDASSLDYADPMYELLVCGRAVK